MGGGGGGGLVILDWELTKSAFLIEEKFKSQEDTILTSVFKDHIFWGQEKKKTMKVYDWSWHWSDVNEALPCKCVGKFRKYLASV